MNGDGTHSASRPLDGQVVDSNGGGSGDVERISPPAKRARIARSFEAILKRSQSRDFSSLDMSDIAEGDYSEASVAGGEDVNRLKQERQGKKINDW